MKSTANDSLLLLTNCELLLLTAHMLLHQEVIEVSQEATRDVQGAAAGASCLDFRVPGGSRAGSKQVCCRVTPLVVLTSVLAALNLYTSCSVADLAGVTRVLPCQQSAWAIKDKFEVKRMAI